MNLSLLIAFLQVSENSSSDGCGTESEENPFVDDRASTCLTLALSSNRALLDISSLCVGVSLRSGEETDSERLKERSDDVQISKDLIGSLSCVSLSKALFV